jgi:sugar/nucleoside kinase (ribokinase family)
MSDVVVAGHVSLDLYPELYGEVRLEPGRLVEVGPVAFSTGGAVTNTGLALHRLGVAVRLLGKVGDDLFGRAVIDALERHSTGLARDLTVSYAESTSYTVVINPPGVDRSFLHCPGANETFGATDLRDEVLRDARLLHFGYPPLMPRMYADDGAELAEMFERSRRAGVATSLDMCVPDPASEAGRVEWHRVLSQTLPFVDVFAPSIEELLFMLDRRAYERLCRDGLAVAVDVASLHELGGRLIAMGAALVAIKLGDQGLYLRAAPDAAALGRLCERAGASIEAWRGCEVLAPCFVARQVAGTTGSGDCTIAGLLAALLRGTDPLEAATAATAVGACSVETVDPTSGIPSWDALQARIAGGWERCALELR